MSANKAEAKLSLPVLLMKVKPPKPITGQGLFLCLEYAVFFRWKRIRGP